MINEHPVYTYVRRIIDKADTSKEQHDRTLYLKGALLQKSLGAPVRLEDPLFTLSTFSNSWNQIAIGARTPEEAIQIWAQSGDLPRDTQRVMAYEFPWTNESPVLADVRSPRSPANWLP